MNEQQNGLDLGAAPMETAATTPAEPAPVTEAPKVAVEPSPAGVTEALGIDGAETAAETAEKEKKIADEIKPQAEKSKEEKPVEKNKKTVEAIIDETVKDLLDENDLHINQLMMGKRSYQYLDEHLHALYPTDDEQKEAKQDPTSMFNLMIRAFRDGWGSNSLLSYLEVLSEKRNDKAIVESLIAQSDKSLGSFGDGSSHTVKTSGVDLTGSEARDAFMAKISGLKKIKLLNSGFWVTLRRPQIYELQDIFDAIDLEQREVGYSIGPHFALVADLYIKKRFCESLIKYRIIRDSNLADIFKGDTFFKALAFHDYDVLVHGLLSLMSRKGMRVRVICPECNHATILEKVDVDSAKYVNQNLITPKMQEWWDAKTTPDGKPIGKRTLKDLKTYREEVLGFKHSFTEKIGDADIRLNYHVPTMSEYFEVGEMLVTQIRNSINEREINDETHRQVILAQLAAHTFQMVSPWISHIEILDGENVVSRTSDAETILTTFDTATQDNSSSPFEQLTKFLADSKISYIGTFSLECPNCHAKPDVGTKNQFYPLEVQTLFFGQLFRLLPAELMPTGTSSQEI